MSGPALRHLPRPRSILIDPWRAWVAPQPGLLRISPQNPALGQSFELRRGPEWIPAQLWAWARLHYTPNAPCWYGNVALDLATADAQLGHTFRLWLPHDAIRLPGPSR